MRPALVISCEHGGKRVPARYRALFEGAARALDSHRGWDPGALSLARELARALDAPLFACTATRLLVDANRSADHPRLFSSFTRGLAAAERDAILARWWQPHRAAVHGLVAGHVARGRAVLHLSVHSFTPRWNGRRRAVDVGFLFDPHRPRERTFADRWLSALSSRQPGLCLRRNQPYRGTTDALVTELRERFGARRYLGLELEVSQRITRGQPARWRRLRKDIRHALREALGPELRWSWSSGARAREGG